MKDRPCFAPSKAAGCAPLPQQWLPTSRLPPAAHAASKSCCACHAIQLCCGPLLCPVVAPAGGANAVQPAQADCSSQQRHPPPHPGKAVSPCCTGHCCHSIVCKCCADCCLCYLLPTGKLHMTPRCGSTIPQLARRPQRPQAQAKLLKRRACIAPAATGSSSRYRPLAPPAQLAKQQQQAAAAAHLAPDHAVLAALLLGLRLVHVRQALQGREQAKQCTTVSARQRSPPRRRQPGAHGLDVPARAHIGAYQQNPVLATALLQPSATCWRSSHSHSKTKKAVAAHQAHLAEVELGLLLAVHALNLHQRGVVVLVGLAPASTRARSGAATAVSRLPAAVHLVEQHGSGTHFIRPAGTEPAAPGVHAGIKAAGCLPLSSLAAAWPPLCHSCELLPRQITTWLPSLLSSRLPWAPPALCRR